MNPEALQRALTFLESWLAYRAEHVDIPGFSVAIYHQDRVVFSRAYGLANIETNEALTTRHVFNIASQSKMLTATALLQLVQKGTVKLSEPASTYLPWLKKHYNPRVQKITIHQLLGHHSGLIRDGIDADFWQLKKAFPNLKELQNTILEADIVENGKIKYSNLGYALLGQIIEAASGQEYETYVTEHILSPLRLSSTYFRKPTDTYYPVATSYSLPHERYQRAPIEYEGSFDTLMPVIGTYSTPEDMCAFAAALFPGNTTLLSDRLKTVAQTSQPLITESDDMEFGLGFEVHEVSARKVIGHTGALFGYVSATFFDPQAKLAVSVMTNCKDASVVSIFRSIFEAIYYFQEFSDSATPAHLARLSTRLKNLLATAEIVATKEKIVAIDPDDWEPFGVAEKLDLINPTTLRVSSGNSVFSESELIRYSFKDDILQSVNYGGATMLPDRAQDKPAELPPALDDLRHINLRVGRIIDIKEHHFKSITFELTIDFGAEVGTKNASISQLFPGSTTETMRGQLLIAAIYPAYRPGQELQAIVVLGPASQAGKAPLISQNFFPITPRLCQGVVIPKSNYYAEVDGWVEKFNQELFKIEPADYPDDTDWAPSLMAWLQGKQQKAIGLIKQDRDTLPGWLQANLRQQKHRRITRIRIIGDELTPFLEWELEYFKHVNIPLTGENIYLLPRQQLGGIDLPKGNVLLFDQNKVVAANRQEDSFTHAVLYDTSSGSDIRDFLKLRTQFMHLAKTSGKKLEI